MTLGVKKKAGGRSIAQAERSRESFANGDAGSQSGGVAFTGDGAFVASRLASPYRFVRAKMSKARTKRGSTPQRCSDWLT